MEILKIGQWLWLAEETPTHLSHRLYTL